ncbi:glutamate-ammonia ligase [Planoprotostelium fungivorum]|uniref:Glutamate-ammonia ligase n=1 Tax=Planoprotostelium fungivorum TaxID=1890364 RepID=A0A2P6ND34_9EUKA|nr:glutamate-ammonia ligase [Planoprotostelium fungivorum]
MFYSRIKALEGINGKEAVQIDYHGQSPADVFDADVFGDKELRERLPPSTYKTFKDIVRDGGHLEPTIADQVASAMKDWAISRGATHFTHWFQPLTNLTAEKHDSFIQVQGESYDRKLVLNFSGKQLIKGEPDASSFPNGGIRSTSEARGYTAWDMTSPSFITHGKSGSTLCIPTAFASWTGEALDTKTPLLRSNEAVSKAAVRLLRLLGVDDVTHVHSNLGVEQEFFVIDRSFYNARPDLRFAGRSVLGAQPAKGQQMEDHYFGKLEPRILSFMQDAEWRLWRLGVPSTTRHNEVAPSQYELAPIYEGVSVACDHNMLMMEVLKETARDHDFAALFHEKPFAGVNGSGKHNNWSLGTNTGINLMEPGDNPQQNLIFLTFTAAVVRTVSLHGDLLRASIATPGNEHRLGANEAPPAIISVFMGAHLEEIIENLVKENGKNWTETKPHMCLGVSALPKLPRDASDRNRTSPFAFTGNKFEFRAVGSSQTCARPITYLNAAMADSIHHIADRVDQVRKEDPKLDRQAAVWKVTIETFREHKRAIFGGNGYSQEWREEAEKRGLWHLRTLPEALQQLTSEKNAKLFAASEIFNSAELAAQQATLYEYYSKSIQIESDVLYDMVSSAVLPTALEFRSNIVKNIDGHSKTQSGYASKVSDLVTNLLVALEEQEKVNEEAKRLHGNEHEQAVFFRSSVCDAMEATRSASDALERVIDDKLWPYPKYSEMLFLK